MLQFHDQTHHLDYWFSNVEMNWNWIVVQNGPARVHYDHWGASKALSTFLGGPSAVFEQASSCELAKHPLEDGWREGGALVDFDRNQALVYGLEGMRGTTVDEYLAWARPKWAPMAVDFSNAFAAYLAEHQIPVTRRKAAYSRPAPFRESRDGDWASCQASAEAILGPVEVDAREIAPRNLPPRQPERRPSPSLNPELLLLLLRDDHERVLHGRPSRGRLLAQYGRAIGALHLGLPHHATQHFEQARRDRLALRQEVPDAIKSSIDRDWRFMELWYHEELLRVLDEQA